MTSVSSLALAPLILSSTQPTVVLPAAVTPAVVPSKTSSKQVTINSLPDTVLAHVLTFLPPQALISMRLTCKAWERLPFQRHHLDLSGYKNLSDDQLQTILEQLKGTKIQSINLQGCSQLTNKGLEHFSKLASLTSLNLSGCPNITDEGIEHLSKLSSLTSLNLSGCHNITDEGLEYLSKLTSLSSLNLEKQIKD